MSDENFQGIEPKKEKTVFPIPPLKLGFGSAEDALAQLKDEYKNYEKKSIRNQDKLMCQESFNQSTAKLNEASRWGDTHSANILRKSAVWPKIDYLILLGRKLDQLDAATEEPKRAEAQKQAAALEAQRNKPENLVAYYFKLEKYSDIRALPREKLLCAVEHFEAKRGSVPPLPLDQTQTLISYLRSLLAESQPAKDEGLARKFGRWVHLP